MADAVSPNERRHQFIQCIEVDPSLWYAEEALAILLQRPSLIQNWHFPKTMFQQRSPFANPIESEVSGPASTAKLLLRPPASILLYQSRGYN